jgi:thiol-disulfide isomerase/thioredoxin
MNERTRVARRLVGLLVVGSLLVRALAAEPAGPLPLDRLVGQRVADGTLIDVRSGRDTRLLEAAVADREPESQPPGAVVLVFVAPGCPLGDKYLPRLDELAAAYAPAGVRVVAVASGGGETRESVAAWIADRQPAFPVLLDRGGVQAAALLVERSNEAILLDRRAEIRYRGAIDDQYGYDFSRSAPRATPLRDAIEAVLRGDPVKVKATPVAGCLITTAKPGAAKRAGAARVRPAQADVAAWLDEQEPMPDVGVVTYHRDVAPIVQVRCQTCHRPGQSGGFDLVTCADAVRHATMLAEVVEQRRMPPWHADPRHGVFANDRRLTPRERATLLAWVAQGCPEGDPAAAPPPRVWPAGWTIGTPDLVFELPTATSVPAQGTMPYVHVAVPTNFAEDVWIQAAEARPGDAAVVHHIIVFVVPPGADAERVVSGGQGFLCGYAPGDMPSLLPAGTAKKIAAGSELVFQLHYTPNGTPAKDRSSVGLIVARERPTREARTIGIVNEEFTIPPGAAAHPVRAERRFGHAVRLLSFTPHMHLRGRSFRYDLVEPRRQEAAEILLNVPAFDFGWQTTYVLREPRILARGATLVCEATFDNSAGNPANPDPSTAVRWGEQTWEEMMIGFLEVDRPLGAWDGDEPPPKRGR